MTQSWKLLTEALLHVEQLLQGGEGALRLSKLARDRIQVERGTGRHEHASIAIEDLAARGLEMELGVHVKAALDSGDVTAAEMMEVVLQVAHYAGFPLGSVIYRKYLTVCSELGLEVPKS